MTTKILVNFCTILLLTNWFINSKCIVTSRHTVGRQFIYHCRLHPEHPCPWVANDKKAWPPLSPWIAYLGFLTLAIRKEVPCTPLFDIWTHYWLPRVFLYKERYNSCTWFIKQILENYWRWTTSISVVKLIGDCSSVVYVLLLIYKPTGFEWASGQWCSWLVKTANKTCQAMLKILNSFSSW